MAAGVDGGKCEALRGEFDRAHVGIQIRDAEKC